MADLDGRSIEVFRMVARIGSATQAAERLNTTQPSITRTIATLEKTCGFILFKRGHRGMTLTPEGSILLEAVERNFAGMRAVQHVVEDIRGGLHGTLRANAIPVLTEGPLGEILGAFSRAHPRISLAVKASFADNVLNETMSGEVDIGGIIGPAPVGLDLEVVPVANRTMALVVAPHHRLANRTHVHFSDLDGEPFVVMVKAHILRVAVEKMMIDFGVRPSVMHENWSQRTIVEMVRHSDAVGFVDAEVIDSVKTGVVIKLDLEPRLSWPVNLVYRRDRTPSAVLSAFLGWLPKHLADNA